MGILGDEMIKVKNSQEFDYLLRALADDIIVAHTHYQLYKDLHQALLDHPSVVHQSNTFWQLTLNAHINTSTLALTRAYDQERDSLHLHSWLLTIRKHLHFFDQEAFRGTATVNRGYVATAIAG
jgi:AbiU2